MESIRSVELLIPNPEQYDETVNDLAYFPRFAESLPNESRRYSIDRIPLLASS